MILKGVGQSGGVTLQTLDDRSFDHGLILDQDLYQIPNPETITFYELLDTVKSAAVKLLIRGLQARLFVPPLVENRCEGQTLPKDLIHAPKITPDDKRISWGIRSRPTMISRQFRALGRLWSTFYLDPKTIKRLIFEDIESLDTPENLKGVKSRALYAPGEGSQHHSIEPSPSAAELNSSSINLVVPADDPEHLHQLFYIEDGDAVIFQVQSGCIRVKRITVEGQRSQAASKAMQGFRQDPRTWRLKSTGILNETSQSELNS